MAGKIDAVLDGERELGRLLRELPKAARKGLRGAMNAAATPISKAAKKNAPRESGLLKRSIGKRVKTYSSGTVAAVIGARREVSGEYKGKKRVPANYAHLVEQGHGGPRPAQAHEFLKPAFDANVEKAIDIASDKLRDVVEREARKLGKL